MEKERDIEFLNKLAKDLFKKYWGLELDIPIVINPKLRRFGSAYYCREWVYENGKRIGSRGTRIEFSKTLLDHFKPEGIIQTLKHELCHHACNKLGKPFSDGSKHFESEIKRIDAVSHSHTHEELLARGYVFKHMIKC